MFAAQLPRPSLTPRVVSEAIDIKNGQEKHSFPVNDLLSRWPVVGLELPIGPYDGTVQSQKGEPLPLLALLNNCYLNLSDGSDNFLQDYPLRNLLPGVSPIGTYPMLFAFPRKLNMTSCYISYKGSTPISGGPYQLPISFHVLNEQELEWWKANAVREGIVFPKCIQDLFTLK